MNGMRCEVCDDTNATIHCQECRRRTCEECDEILHLVDANKSHHRIPLFPSRGGSNVNSSHGSLAATRNVSPRGLRRADEAPVASMVTNSSWPPETSNYSGKPLDSNNYGAQFDGGSSPGEYSQPPPRQQPVQQAPQRQSPPPPNDYIQPLPQQQQQRTQPPPPPEQKQPVRYQQNNGYTQNAYQQPQREPQHQQQPQHQPQQQYRQPQQSYSQARSGYATPSAGVGAGQARSGYATPTHTNYQYPVPRSMTHSGAATPTYGQSGHRYSAGTVPYSQWNQQQNQTTAQPRLVDQKPMDNVSAQQQAYLQHVELIQQHKAVEAHQRLMSQRQDSTAQARAPQQPAQYYPHQPQQAPPQQQRYTTSYLMSNHGSLVSSVAPSARNSPPMQPMQPRLAVPNFMPPLEPGRHYLPADGSYSRNSVPQPQPIRQQFYGQHYSGYATPSVPSVYPVSHNRTPYNEPRSPPMYTHAMNIGSVPRTPYNEPRTPYNEPQMIPRMTNNEQPILRPAAPQNARSALDPALKQVPQNRQQSPPAYNQSAQSQSYGAPINSYAPHQIAQSQPQRSAPTPQRSAPMPNNYSNYSTPLQDKVVSGAPNGNTAPSWSSRYDPDEAEMRVRNLIADTERMLAGLSALSGTSTQKPSEGVSV